MNQTKISSKIYWFSCVFSIIFRVKLFFKIDTYIFNYSNCVIFVCIFKLIILRKTIFRKNRSTFLIFRNSSVALTAKQKKTEEN